MHPGAALAHITLASHGQPVITWLFQDITFYVCFQQIRVYVYEKKNQFCFTLYETIAKIFFSFF